MQSTKKQVSRHREIYIPEQGEDPSRGHFVKKYKPRDPRFDNLSGHYNKHLFGESYKFLDEYRMKEFSELKALFKQTKDPQVKKLMDKKKQEIDAVDYDKKALAIKQNFRAKQKKAIEQGKQPYFLSKTAIKQQLHEQKIDELRQSKKYDKYAARKRAREDKRDRDKIRKIGKRTS